MATKKLVILLTILMNMVGIKALAYDIAVENADGVTIYYNYYSDGTELEVAQGVYSGIVNIPEEVTYMNRTRKVASIGNYAFNECTNLISVSMSNSVRTIRDFAFFKCSSLSSVTIGNSVSRSQRDWHLSVDPHTQMLVPLANEIMGVGSTDHFLR